MSFFDESGDVAGRAHCVWGPPTVYFLDRQGRLIGRAVGPRDWPTGAAHRFVHALLDEREP